VLRSATSARLPVHPITIPAPADLPGSGASDVRFLHTADWQLGMNRHFLEGEAQARYESDRPAARENMVKEIGELFGITRESAYSYVARKTAC
jgi:hypothetical protein